MVNNLRARIHAAADKDEKNSLFSETRTVLQRVCDFPVQQWVDEVVLPGLSVEDTAHFPRHDSIITSRLKSRRWTWLAFISAYKSAIALYCLSTIFGVGYLSASERSALQSGDNIAHETDYAFHWKTLRGNLQLVVSDQEDHLRKFTIWPMVILGLTASPMDEASKVFVTNELRWISKNVGTASPLIAIEVLLALWRSVGQRTLPGTTVVTWDSVFKQPYIFAL